MSNYPLFLASLFIVFSAYSCGTNIKPNNKLSSIPVMIADTTEATNDFYDNAETYWLQTNNLEVTGEITNPGKVDFTGLPIHSVIVKETLLNEKGDQFVGAYRYDGYSLYDILNTRHLNKKNADEFRPIIDLYVEVENEQGEKAVISWGEIYYPNHRHEIIVATQVARIVPSLTKDLWELPKDCKLVVAGDLITERNISRPSKITIKSFPIELKVEKGKNPIYSPEINLYLENKLNETLYKNPENLTDEQLHTIFYGRGRGIHSTQPFTGIPLNQFFATKINMTQQAIRKGLFVFTADDGYRTVFTYSELCNRNDQANVLLICRPEDTNEGIFRIFPSCDFFSDRAIKAINAIYYTEKQHEL